MVEKIELAIVFKTLHINDDVKEFLPIKVIVGTFDKDNNWFNDTKEGEVYLHIDVPSPKNTSYACRTTIEMMKESLSTDSIEKIKQEMFDYAKQFTYIRDRERNDFIIAKHKETGDEAVFEDIDNMPEFIKEKNGPSISGDNEILLMTPKEIENQVKRSIKGQDEAIRKIVTALWITMNFRNMRKKNMLIIGPSGVGKTAIFEKIKKILNVPVVIFPVPGLSQAGYVGRSTDEILKQIYYEADFNLDVAERAIVILDEIDKIAEKGSDGVSTSGVQNELLKIIEGCERYVETGNPHDPYFTIDTSEMIFIGAGAFQELFEKEPPKIGIDTNNKIKKEDKKVDTDRLINYGLKRELIGRLPIVVELNNLGAKELKEIIMESDESELLNTIHALDILNVEIENLDEVIDILVEDALTKKIGARGLVFTINNIFEEIFYEIGNNPAVYEKVVIGKDIINNPYDFELIERRTKKRVRVKKEN